MTETWRGIYVHVPFCVRKCHYCDFNSYSLDRAAVQLFLDAVDKEIAMYESAVDLPPGAAFDTLFIGGGTPTCLSTKDLAGLIRRLRDAFPLREGAEITCEANPGTVHHEKFAAMIEAGVNRLSMGVQSLDDALLARIGRDHSAADALASFAAARAAGFDNINLDLMFGLPGQTEEAWQETLTAALDLGPDHLSCYSLIVEDGTPFGDAFARGELPLPSEDEEAAMYAWAIDRLKASGFHHYEIANFALPGRESRHNQIYWRTDPYLAFGPGAHGYWAGERYANLRLPSEYAARVERGERPLENARSIGVDEQMEDALIFGLRLIDGVSLPRFRARFGRDALDVYGEAVDRLLALELIEVDESSLKLSAKGLPVANQVFVAFLRDP